MSEPKKLQTIEEAFGMPAGSFNKFIETQDAEAAVMEEERKAHIRKVRSCKHDFENVAPYVFRCKNCGKIEEH